MEENRQSKRLEARRRAKRRKVIRNRILVALILIVLILAIILLIKTTAGESGNADTSQAPESTSDVATEDKTPPVITGAKDLEITAGSTVSYMTGVTVTDDTDPNPTLDVDNSLVDLMTPGSYDVVYTARDASGNVATVTIKLTVTEAPTKDSEATEEEIAELHSLAKQYLRKIVKDDMSDYEKAKRIWLWVNYNMDYSPDSDKTSWVRGALQYFNKRKGDCFNYFAAAKALLEECGIQNVDVVKSDTSHSSHYWSLVNLGDGWYHYDTTPREGPGDYFFLVTDAQLDAYSAAHDGSHTFDHDIYPARSTEIITDLDSQPEYSSFFDE